MALPQVMDPTQQQRMNFRLSSADSRFRLKHIGLRVLLLATMITSGALGTLTAADSTTNASAITDVLRAFRSAGRDSQKRTAAVDRAIAVGPAAAQRLQLILAKEMSKPLEGYRKRFTQAAMRLSVQRASQINPAEITALRQKFSALSGNEALSKDQIRSQGDPIIEQLERLLVIDRHDITTARPELQAQRQQLEQTGLLWEKCAIVAYQELLEKTPDPEIRQRITKPSIAAFLDNEEKIAARLAMPMPNRDRSVLTANARQAARLDSGESRAILATNLLRLLVGLSPCAVDLRLTAAARDHSADMKKLKFFSHESPVQGKRQFTSRAANFGTSASAENIAINNGQGSAVVKAWYYSPGHHRNMFGNHRRIGVGQAGRYWTQMFGR